MTEDDFIGMVRKAAEDWASYEGISATNFILGVEIRDGKVEVRFID
jgi:hypothetical protein